jgi:hypothetical protein
MELLFIATKANLLCWKTFWTPLKQRLAESCTGVTTIVLLVSQKFMC